MVSKSVRQRIFVVFVAVLMSVAIGCTTTNRPCVAGKAITIPVSDVSSPTSAMDIHFPSKPSATVMEGSGDIEIKVGGNDAITLLAVGNDPEGVKDIQIWIQETWWFANPTTGIVSQRGPGLLGAPEKQNVDSSTSGTVCSSRATNLKLDVGQRRAGATQYRARSWAKALNFSNKESTTSQATFNWP